MFGSTQPESLIPPREESRNQETASGALPGNGSFEGQELDAALQLLVERAQYITGATGAALALSQGDEMVCRASAGSSSPAIGARLQVHSGLSGESIARKQLLRCDNAEADPRVNLETCRQFGIASIVVLPLLTRNREVRGLFELFSDHPHAFEERDLIALERMADLTLTALDLAERRPVAVTGPVSATDAIPSPPAEGRDDQNEKMQPPPDQADTASHLALTDEAPAVSVAPALLSGAADALQLPPDQPLGAAQVHSALFQEAVLEAQPAPVPEAMRRIQKCASCGFPVSDGRTLCLDCENKSHPQSESGEAASAEPVPAFLVSSKPPGESWVTNHVNVLAVIVLILSIVVAVVVFR